MPSGIPCSGPRQSPRAISISARHACSRARLPAIGRGGIEDDARMDVGEIQRPQLLDLLENSRERGQILGKLLGRQIDAEDIADEIERLGLAHGALPPPPGRRGGGSRSIRTTSAGAATATPFFFGMPATNGMSWRRAMPWIRRSSGTGSG